jgi:hypothetical protein
MVNLGRATDTEEAQQALVLTSISPGECKMVGESGVSTPRCPSAHQHILGSSVRLPTIASTSLVTNYKLACPIEVNGYHSSQHCPKCGVSTAWSCEPLAAGFREPSGLVGSGCSCPFTLVSLSMMWLVPQVSVHSGCVALMPGPKHPR